MTHPFQWSFFIGPAWKPASSPFFYNWAGFDADTEDNLVIEDTLTATLADGATTMTVSNTGLFASAGGAWVGPNGSGQAWEYVEYSGEAGSTLTGLVREPSADREHNGVHTNGAKVRPWWHVASNNGVLRCSMALDDTLVASEWQVDLSGIAAPQAAFRPFHLAVISYRTGVSGNLLNMLVGFLDSSTIRDDAKRKGEWSVRMGSLAGLLKKIKAEGVRVGEFDAIRHGTVTSSTPLGAPHKERGSGDFVAAAPDFNAQSVSEETGGIWIGDRFVGTTETPSGYSGFSQLYINPPASLNAGCKWLEVINRGTASVDLVAYNADTDTEVALTIDTMDATGNKRIIVCEDEARFLAENPSHEADFIVNVRLSDTQPFWFNNLKPEGGAVAFKFFGDYQDAVFWGTEDESSTDWSSSDWNGPAMAAPGLDETMRYKMLDNGHTNTKDDWEVGKRQSPGYTINNSGEDVWIAVELPSMGLVLHDDISDSDPDNGDTLYIDGQNGPSTDGLPSSGTLVIGDERISYSAKVTGGVTVDARGEDGTAAADHVAGDAIFLVFTQDGDTSITDALPLSAIVWERFGGTIYPKDFTYRYAALASRTPGDDENYDDDYDVVNNITGNTASSYSHGLSDNRAKTILLQFKKMTTDPARPRLNRWKALVDPAYFASEQWLSGGETIEELIAQIALNVGIPSGAITAGAGGAEPSGFTTAIDNAWAVMASAAEMGGSYVRVTRDSSLVIAPDDFWLEAVGDYAPVKTWTRENASSIEFIRSGGGMVSQVRINWQTPDGTEGGVAKWPATPAEMGAAMEIGPLYFANETAAALAARKRYYLQRYPYLFGITLAAGDLEVEPRQVHRLTDWQLADGMQDLDRTILVTQVEHVVEKMTLTTSLYGIQIDRESDG